MEARQPAPAGEVFIIVLSMLPVASAAPTGVGWLSGQVAMERPGRRD
jgi:hypothetical protein